jgi:peptidyl-prolyl cis-trans isomerase SurA
MKRARPTRFTNAAAIIRLVCVCALAVALLPAAAQPGDKSPESGSAVIDRVVAVVNRQVILASDLQDEMQLAVLNPNNSGGQKITERQALDQLISRTLIQQQIRQDDVESAEPKPEEIQARVNEIRTELPICVQADCKSDAGWTAFLAHHDLTPKRVENYLRNRLKILSFIEMRFRQGIRITPEEIQAYYQDKLVPQYPSGQTPPPLEQVSSRIEEILLEQKVNALFGDWLSNLRKQGQIEVLDPSLESASTGDSEGATRE